MTLTTLALGKSQKYLWLRADVSININRFIVPKDFLAISIPPNKTLDIW